MANNLWMLWRQLLKHPRELGTVAPSSRWLAQGLVQASDITEDHTIVEVGAGTGPLTHWIRASVPKANFFAMEPNPDMAALLRARFMGLDVCEERVEALPQMLQERGLNKADRILSSVPWSLFPIKELESSVDAICDSLADDGFFVTLVYAHARQFPSSMQMKQLVEGKFNTVYYSDVIWRNIPPGNWLVCRNPIRNSQSLNGQ